MKRGLRYLYREFNRIYEGIGTICGGCTDHDCEGFVALLEEESDLLYNMGIPILVANGNTSFIHSFREVNGRIAIDMPKVPCVLREGGGCTIYNDRPLICRMYPVGIAIQEGKPQLVLYQDCRFSRELRGRHKKSFFDRVRRIMNLTSLETLQSIWDLHIRVRGISVFPEGENHIEVISPFAEFLTEGG